jgi:hypothetical protein
MVLQVDERHCRAAGCGSNLYGFDDPSGNTMANRTR